MIIGTTKEEADFLREMRFIDDYPQLMETLNKPRFTIKDIGVTPRDATYWDQQKAFPKLKTEGSSRRLYSLSQAIWIKFIQQMRGHGIPLKKIVEYKSDILGDELDVKALFEDQEALSKMKELFKNSDKAEEFEQMIEDPEFGSILEGIQLSIFEMLILLSIVVKKSYGYIVPINDEIFPYCFDQHQQFIKHKENFSNIMKSTHFYLSISDALSELISDWYEKEWFNNLSIVSKKEEEIIQMLRDPYTAELHIFKDNSKIPDRVIKVEKRRSIAIDEFANYILKNGYQNIQVQTRSGNVVNFRNEISMKI
tara:strand:+ start:16572 stop:17501 length:930 start_codon:yes stop_codon:yes gene_type:complete